MLRPANILLYLMALLVIPVVCSAQQQQLDSVLKKENRNNLPGFAVRVLKNNETIYEYSCGQANIRKHIPLSSYSTVNIASVSKQFTAYGIYLLEERGLLKTDAEVHTYLPELPDFGAPITLKHLLGHTSGLRDYPDFISLLNESTNHNLTYPKMVEFLRGQHELNFPPGSQFCYSNTGYMMLARIIEIVSGKSYAVFMRDEIFRPLGMTQTFVNEGIVNEQPDGTTNYLLNEKKTKASKGRAHRDVIGATGIFSSIEDLSKWNRLFFEHESGLKTSSVIAKMETSFVLNDGNSVHYGGGLLLKEYRGKPVIEHSGGWGEYLTQYRRFPEENITIIVVTNSMLDSPFDICDKISNVLLKFHEELPQSNSSSCYPLQKLNGVYLSEDNFIRFIEASDEKTLIIRNATKTTQSRYTLVGSDCITNDSVTLFFQDSCRNLVQFNCTSDSTAEFIWSAGTYFQNRHTYIRYPKEDVKHEKRIKGHYYSPELDLTIKVHYNRRRKEYVFILFPWMRVSLKPVAKDVFQLEGETYLIRFKGNTLIFGNDWINNLKFYKQN